MMINPETLNIESLPWMPLEEKSAFPKQSAIYFAIDSQGDIQYIGRSANVKQRWIQHHKFDDLQAIGNVRIAYLFMEPDLLPSVEGALIEWFHPPLNTMYPREIKQSPRIKGVMYVAVSIAKWFPRALDGEFASVNSVFESVRNTPNEVGRNTLRLALDGRLTRGNFDNQVKLARLCSLWSGECVTINDLMIVED